MSLRQEQSIFSLDLVTLLLWATNEGYEYTLGEVHRTSEQQAIYYKTGRSKTMDSFHLKRLAADIFFFKDGKLLQTKEELQPIGDKWESFGEKNSWGGNWNSFKDLPHFERRA
jgi:peptidoglycan L-alanyl-D-glutamate endopeptidase CwlK